jgi:chaperonin GroES
MTLQVLNDRVMVEKNTDKKTTASGLIIASDVTEKSVTGKVFAVGDGKQLDNGQTRPMLVKVGDTVLYAKGTGIEIKVDGIDYIVMHEHDIIGILE